MKVNRTLIEDFTQVYVIDLRITVQESNFKATEAMRELFRLMANVMKDAGIRVQGMAEQIATVKRMDIIIAPKPDYTPKFGFKGKINTKVHHKHFLQAHKKK